MAPAGEIPQRRGGGRDRLRRMSRRTVFDMVNDAKAAIEELSVDELAAEIEAGSCTVIDIRDFRERLNLGAIPGAEERARHPCAGT